MNYVRGAKQFRQFRVGIFEDRTPRGTRGTVDFAYSAKCVPCSTHTRHSLFITN